MNPEVVVHRGLGGTVADLMLFDGAVCSQGFEMLFAIRLPTPMLTGYANGLAIPTKGLALSLLSHTRNDIKHLQRNQGFGKHQTHERVNDYAYY